jgi:hypothetical protein
MIYEDAAPVFDFTIEKRFSNSPFTSARMLMLVLLPDSFSLTIVLRSSCKGENESGKVSVIQEVKLALNNERFWGMVSKVFCSKILLK